MTILDNPQNFGQKLPQHPHPYVFQPPFRIPVLKRHTGDEEIATLRQKLFEERTQKDHLEVRCPDGDDSHSGLPDTL